MNVIKIELIQVIEYRSQNGKYEVIVRYKSFNIIYIMRNKMDLKNLNYISIHAYFLNAFGVTPVQFLKALEK